jgi:hypothetical protein
MGRVREEKQKKQELIRKPFIANLDRGDPATIF